MTRWLKAICVSILAAASISAAAPPTVTLAVPGRANANVSMAAAGDFVAVAWGASAESGSTDIYTAVSRDAGRTFTAPVRASDAQAGAQISGEQPPHVALVPRPSGGPSVVVVWTAKGTTGTRLLTARSNDGGRSFGRPATVPGSDAPGNRGWEATATDRDGHVDAIWLDHRALAETGGMPMHHHGQEHTVPTPTPDGALKAQASKLYFGRLDGSEGAREVTGGVCYCCKTALAAGADGSLYAAWRHVYPGNIRDIAFTLSRDGGRTFAAPVRVSEDKWVLDGCPENGPAMAIGARGRINVVWPTLVSGPPAGAEPTLALFYSSSNDGRRFSARQRIPTEGAPYHAQMAINAADGSLLLVWDELKEGVRRAVAARGVADSAGSMRFVREEMAAPRSAYPVVASTRSGAVRAWTDTSRTLSVIAVQRVP